MSKVSSLLNYVRFHLYFECWNRNIDYCTKTEESEIYGSGYASYFFSNS